MLYLLLTVLVALAPGQTVAKFLIGRGVADATGAIAEGILYGYANPYQDARGLHLRQFSRAFIVAETNSTTRVAVVVVEASMVSQAVTLGVMEKLNELYGDLYTEQNVLLSPTHSHSCPGGFHTFVMYMVPSLGFVPQTYDAFVNGIVKSIMRAHESLQEGDILLSHGDLTGAGINRSPAAYDNNPAHERAKYSTNTDVTMTLLKFKATGGDDLGVISFFPVHPTSMKKTNHLLSTDNKGYAAQLMERYLNPGSHPGQVTVPAAFAQTTNGDVSPAIQGSFCEGTDEPCDYVTSTCEAEPKNPALCTGRGPAGEEFEDTRIIGEKQYSKAKDLYEAAGTEVTGPVGFVHLHVNMSSLVVTVNQSQQVQLCRPAMGFSFAAGATDGPGIPPFVQGDTDGDAYIQNTIRGLLPYPDDFITCHQPKPILLPSGYALQSWPFQPEIVPLQILRIGDLVLIGMPAEITTMSGRRVADAVKDAMVAAGAPSTIRPLVLSMTNSYTSYLTTPEEYQIQRYEGGSTIFGPNTLNGYIQQLSKMATALAKSEKMEPGPTPPDLRGKSPVLVGKPKSDSKSFGEKFGGILVDVNPSYQQGDTASVTFRSGNPRNDLRTEDTYLAVQQQNTDSSWKVVATDAYWETRLHWSSNCQDVGFIPPLRCLLSQTSNVTVTWDVPASQQPGSYRLVHYGKAKTTLGGIVSYTGVSAVFNVTMATDSQKWLHSFIRNPYH